MNPTCSRLRVTYAKHGRAAYLSHLEICRALERCVRRAGLPFAVSQGFSPHMRLSFGSALPVGVAGAAEVFDVVLTEEVDVEQARARLAAAAAADLPIEDCGYVGSKDPAASVAFPRSTYRAVFDGDISDVRFPETVVVKRKGRERVLNVADFLVDGPTRDGDELEFTLLSSQTGSLRVDALIDALVDVPDNVRCLSIERIALSR